MSVRSICLILFSGKIHVPAKSLLSTGPTVYSLYNKMQKKRKNLLTSEQPFAILQSHQKNEQLFVYHRIIEYPLGFHR